MSADRYLKVILTVIAIELGWLAINDTTVAVSAQRSAPAPMPVVLKGIDLMPRETLPVTLTGNNAIVPVTLAGSNAVVRVMSAAPLQLEQPVIIQADRPIVVETASRPLLTQAVPPVAAQRPGVP